MKKKIFIFIFTIITLFLLWFLFIKKYDYQINFTAKTSPGTVYSRILQINSWNTSTFHHDITTTKSLAFKKVYQTIKHKNNNYLFYWKINSLNDSITQVKVYIKDPKHSLKQRILYLVGQSNFIKKSILFVSDFNKALNQHLSQVKVSISGKKIKPTQGPFIFVNFKTKLPSKAGKMASSIYFLANYLKIHHIKKAGNPFLEIKNWNRQDNSIDANFCFPVEKLNFYPSDSVVKIKKSLPAFNALKAVFHGNYRYSDRAWFALDNFAKKHDIKVKQGIIEMYHNDPHTDPNELTWKATIYMPIKNESL
ncbi:MAG: GyrI-like domain-containing protein [Lutibacter sp.]